MDIRSVLMERIGVLEVNWVVDALLNDKMKFADFFKLLDDSDEHVAWHALWVCEHLSKRKGCDWLTIYAPELADRALHCRHDGMRRLYLNILQRLPLERPVRVDLLDACLDWMQSELQPVAVQAVSMKMAYRLVRDESELLSEFRCLLDMMQLLNLPPAMISTIRNIRKRMPKG